MANTPNRGYPLPNEAATVRDEFYRLMLEILPMIDADMAQVILDIAQKADKVHTHQMDQIAGLAQALASKMPADTQLTFANLQDVDGVAAAPDGYIPIKSGSRIIMMAALAALGNHNHTMAQVNGLADALALRLAKASNLSDIADPVTARRNLKIWTGTEAQYNAISAKDSTTLYFIT